MITSANGVVTYFVSTDGISEQTSGHYKVDDNGVLHIANEEGLVCASFPAGKWSQAEVEPQ